MRLIDADKLKNDISWFDHHETRDITTKDVYEAIKEQPTVDAVPKEYLRQLIEVLEDSVESKKKEAYKATEAIIVMLNVEIMKSIENIISWIKNVGELNEKET